MKAGCPPTARHERPGLLTPPGMTCCAAANSCSDLEPMTPPTGVTRGLPSRNSRRQRLATSPGMPYTALRPAFATLAPAARSEPTVEKAVRNSPGPGLQRTWRAILDRLAERVAARDLDELL